MTISAPDPSQRRRRLWRAQDCPIADGHHGRTTTAQALQLVRFIRARDHSVAQFVFRQTLSVTALERIRWTPC